jgi:hypothetical protein
MSGSTDHAGLRCEAPRGLKRFSFAVKAEIPGVFADLGTVLLAGLCLAGVVIVLSTFDGDLQGSDEVVGASLGTLCLFAILAALELADRIKGKRYCLDGRAPTK